MYQVIQNQAWFHHSFEAGSGWVGSRLILTYSSTNDSDIDVCWLWISLDFEMVPLQLLIVTVFLTIDLTYFLIEHIFWSSQFVIVK